jgi:hypothetical protein
MGIPDDFWQKITLTGELSVKEFFDIILGDIDGLAMFSSDFKSKILDPTSKSFESVFSKLNNKLKTADASIDKLNMIQVVKTLDFSKQKEQIDKKFNDITNKLDKKLKDLDKEVTSKTEEKQTPPIPPIFSAKTYQKSEKEIEQKQTDEDIPISFSVHAQEYLEGKFLTKFFSLFESKEKTLLNPFIDGLNKQFKNLKDRNGEGERGLLDNLLTGAEIGASEGLLSRLFGKRAAGAAAGAAVGEAEAVSGATIASILGGTAGLAILASVSALLLSSAFRDKLKPWLQQNFGIKSEDADKGFSVGQDVGKATLTGYTMYSAAKARDEIMRRQNAAKAQEVAKGKLAESEGWMESWSRNKGNKPINELTMNEKKELEALEKEIADLKKIAFPELEVGTKFLKEATPVTKSLFGIMKGVFNGQILQKAFGPAATRIGAKIFGNSLKALKILPGIGALVGAYFAWDRFNKGDYIGSFLDSISAVSDILSIASAPTGIGPIVFEAISIGATVLEAILDWNGVTGGDYKKEDKKNTANYRIGEVFKGMSKMLSESKFISGVIRGLGGIGRFINALMDGNLTEVGKSLVDMSMFPALAGLGSDLMSLLNINDNEQANVNPNIKNPKINKNLLAKQKELYDYNLAYGETGGKKEEREKLKKEIDELKKSKESDNSVSDNQTQVNDSVFQSGSVQGIKTSNGYFKVNQNDEVFTGPFSSMNKEVVAAIENMSNKITFAMTGLSQRMSQDSGRGNTSVNVSNSKSGGISYNSSSDDMILRFRTKQYMENRSLRYC